MKYVAFLRGINSGKNPMIKMEVLRKAFEELGFENVKTVISSGNVIFETANIDTDALELEIESNLPDKIGFKSSAFVYKSDELQQLIEKNPFSNIELSSQVKPYVTFIKNGMRIPLSLPYEGDGFTILENFHGMVCSTVDFSKSNSPALMKVLDKELGKENTTRSWKTVEKVTLA